MESIKIGWGMRSITPDKPVLLAGQFHDRIADRVRDPVMVTAMAIEGADGEQAVMVSCDLVGIEDHILEGVRARLRNDIPELDSDLVILNVTHTHTAPTLKGFIESRVRPFLTCPREYPGIMTPDEYSDLVIGRIVEAVKEAWLGRRQGGLSWGEGYAAIGHNRMVLYHDGMAKMYGNVDSIFFKGFGGPEDHRVEMMFTWDQNIELTGIIVNMACPAQIIEHESFISADYISEVRELVKQKWGPSVHVLGTIGASGDLAPRDLMRNKAHGKLEGDEELRAAATSLVRAMEAGLETTGRTIDTNPVLKHRVRNVSLPLRRVEKEETERAISQWEAFRNAKESQEDDLVYFESLGFARQMEIFNDWALQKHYHRLRQHAFYQMELHVLRIGDSALVTNPFELYTEYGLQIKARSAAKQTFISQLTCGSGGYLPTASAIASGGYGTQLLSGAVGDEGGRLLVEHTLEAIQSVWQDPA